MHCEETNWVATIRRVAAGDQAALRELYDATSPLVLGLIRRIVQDIPTAEDITLDVYMQVWRLAPNYAEEKGTPITWLLMLARSRAIDHLRSPARRARDLERPIENTWGYLHPDPQPDPEVSAIAGDRRRIIRDALAQLPAEQVSVVQMAFFEGLNHIEIAEKTGIPLGTIKSRIRTGLMRMRELLHRAGASQ